MKKTIIIFLCIILIPLICYSAERHVSIGGVSFYIGQPVRNVSSLYNQSSGYKITEEMNINEAGVDKQYYVSEKETNLIIGVIKIAKGKVIKITRHWTSGSHSTEEISRALFESLREHILIEGANAVISTEENSSPEMTMKDITIKGKKSSITISIVEGHGRNKDTAITIFDTTGR
jgi:hypothetical protein